MFEHDGAEELAVELVQATMPPGTLQERNQTQLRVLDILLERTDVDPIDGLVIVSRIYSAKHPH